MGEVKAGSNSDFWSVFTFEEMTPGTGMVRRKVCKVYRHLGKCIPKTE